MAMQASQLAMETTLGPGNVQRDACKQAYDPLMDTFMGLQKTTHWDTNKSARQLGDNFMILVDDLIELGCNILSNLFTSHTVNTQYINSARLPADKI